MNDQELAIYQQQALAAPADMQHLQRLLKEQIEPMLFDRLMTQATLENIGRTHIMATLEIARSQATADLLRQGRGNQISETEQLIYQQLDARLGAAVDQAVDLLNTRSLQRLAEASYRPRRFWE